MRKNLNGNSAIITNYTGSDVTGSGVTSGVVENKS